MVNVHLDDIRKEFGSLVAVEDVNLTIHENEFVTLVGPSGCGKTTTLRLLAGLEEATSGKIRYGDTEVTHLPPQQRDVALLFQDIALYPHMTVKQNMAYGLKIAGVPKEERFERVREVSEMLQIEDLLENKPNALSGGQQQRVALGRSMVRDPTLFLFDEPMSDLDAKLKRELRPLFEEVTREIGCPTLYVTHDQEEAMTMSDRVAVMNDGSLQQSSPPEEVYNEPNSRFVGEFMGQPTMEFFDSRVADSGDGRITCEIAERTWDLPSANGLADYVGEEVEIGVRPQAIEVSTDLEAGIPATHVLDEPLGDQTHSFFDTEFGRITVVTPPDFEGEQREYSLVLQTDRAKVFDSSSGVRIG